MKRKNSKRNAGKEPESPRSIKKKRRTTTAKRSTLTKCAINRFGGLMGGTVQDITSKSNEELFELLPEIMQLQKLIVTKENIIPESGIVPHLMKPGKSRYALEVRDREVPTLKGIVRVSDFYSYNRTLMFDPLDPSNKEEKEFVDRMNECKPISVKVEGPQKIYRFEKMLDIDLLVAFGCGKYLMQQVIEKCKQIRHFDFIVFESTPYAKGFYDKIKSDLGIVEVDTRVVGRKGEKDSEYVHMFPEAVDLQRSIIYAIDVTSKEPILKRKSVENSWDNKVATLEGHYDIHGNCKLPSSHRLYNFVKNTRQFFDKLNNDQKLRLEKIGIGRATSNDEKWLDKFNQLESLKQKDGSFLPTTNSKLSNWMRHQKEQYASSFDSSRNSKALNKERMEMLKSIGFLNEAMIPGMKDKKNEKEEKDKCVKTLIAMSNVEQKEDKEEEEEEVEEEEEKGNEKEEEEEYDDSEDEKPRAVLV